MTDIPRQSGPPRATLVVLAFLPATRAKAELIYDANADFEAGWVAGTNPNGVWSYGWTPGISGALTLFTRNHIPNVNNDLEHMWDDPNNNLGFAPSVARNAGGDFDDGNVTFLAGALISHPGDGDVYSHVIWTAPQAGTYSLASTFFAQQNGINVDVHVLVNGVSVFDNDITSNGVSRDFDDVVTLSAGDTIDFAVGPNGDFNLHPGNTGLDATIRATNGNGVPEPATFVVFSLGAVAFFGASRLQRRPWKSGVAVGASRSSMTL
ncbi:MAG: PEP-CTERM sorting domain-containing protein [Planctomycetaceae bacterium]